ncbi:MAG TPA: CCA tRNA nucleotidyltransferase [Candidatus Latescibacteria bacterium]|nr:CCA tRNA nucleotidyltransferase [Candidatus Latescibacterota bacterium]
MPQIANSDHQGDQREGSLSPDAIADLIERRLPPRIRTLFERIAYVADEIGVNVYLVGGMPRDLLLGEPNLDVDIVVEGDGIGFAKELVAREGGLVKPHKRFQTAIVTLPDRFKVDVATARTEKYEGPAALPVVEASGIEQDLYRRDFTINSLAIQLNRGSYGRLVDRFGGYRDLAAGVVRVLHDLSFVDDPMRIIRAVRFEGRYGFSMDEKTERLLREALEQGLLDQASNERIGKEIILILKEADPLPAVLRLDQLGILCAIHPSLGVSRSTERLFSSIADVLYQFKLRIDSWVVYLLALIYPLQPDERRQVAMRLRLPKRAGICVDRLEGMSERLDGDLTSAGQINPSRIYFLLKDVPLELLLFLAACSIGILRDRISLYIQKLRDVRTRITGRDLERLGLLPGPELGRILNRVLAARLDGQVGSKQEELELAKRLMSR